MARTTGRFPNFSIGRACKKSTAVNPPARAPHVAMGSEHGSEALFMGSKGLFFNINVRNLAIFLIQHRTGDFNYRREHLQVNAWRRARELDRPGNCNQTEWCSNSNHVHSGNPISFPLCPAVSDGDMTVIRQDAIPILALFPSNSSNLELRAG